MSVQKIKPIKAQIRIQELDGTVQSLNRLYEADAKAQKNAFIKGTMKDLTDYSKRLNTSILQNKVLSNLSELDDARDAAFTDFCTAARAYADLPVPTLSEKAKTLRAICDKYNKANLKNVSFVAESSQLESFFGEVEGEAENITALEGLTAKLDALKSAQTAFSAAYDAYINTLNGKSAAASSYKKPILELVNRTLVPYLNAMLMDKESGCADFASKCGTLFDKVNEQVKKYTK